MNSEGEDAEGFIDLTIENVHLIGNKRTLNTNV